MRINNRQRGEIDARTFLGDETWRKWKQDYDELMAFRKSLKGKPTDEQRATLEMNAIWIAHYDTVLWHSAWLAQTDRCACATCDRRRQAASRAK